MSELPLQQALRTVHLLADLTEPKLQWIAEHCVDLRYGPGEITTNAGDPADAMIFMLEGEIEGRADEVDRPVYQAEAGETTGKLPHSRMTTFPRTIRAVGDVRIARMHETNFTALFQNVPELEVPLIRLMADRIREFTTAEVQQSKLAALGKLSAGLAHELNNPAAAAARAAGSLREKLASIRELDHELAASSLTADQRARIVDLEAQSLKSARSCTALDAVTRSDREEALGSLLSDMGVENAWDLAPELSDAGFTPDRLADVAQASDGVLPKVLERIGVLIQLDRLAEEIQDSMARISGLVRAIKDYTYMDTAAEREVDVHKDIENTLRILKGKLDRAGIEIERDYDKSLPLVCANGSELNQVWTNLIDNAADAMGSMSDDKKVLHIRTALRVDRILIEVGDTGPGIPASVREHIFEPFFTTKKQGQGTGLGLDAVRRIVRRHHGDVRVESRPGATCFQVTIPLKQPGTKKGDES